MNLIRENRFGRGIAVPCKRPISSTEDLIKEAKQLWAVEDNKEYFPRILTCKAWGRIALLKNPERPMPTEFLDGWDSHISSEAHYRKVKKPPNCEEPPVNEDGFLKIPWPKLADGSPLAIDALLTTVTEPTITDDNDYPSAQMIAKAWTTPKGKNHVDYFCKNRAHGIKTFQDAEIQDRLCELWL